MTGFISSPYSLVTPGAVGLPNFVASGTPIDGTTTANVVLPSGLIANDIMLLFVETANQNIDALAGWAHVTGSPAGHGVAGGTSATQLSVLWKRHTGSETDPITVTATGANHLACQIFGFRNCKVVGDPWNAVAFDGTGGGSSTATCPTITTTVASCLVVFISTSSIDLLTLGTFFSGYTNAALANITEIANVTGSTGNGGGFGAATGEKTVAGVVGTSTINLNISSEWSTAQIALSST